MGNRAVKQPNGLYARFSDIVDDFTHYNYTRDQMLNEYRIEFGMERAKGKLQRADENPNRFKEEMETVKLIHGVKTYKKRMSQMANNIEEQNGHNAQHLPNTAS